MNRFTALLAGLFFILISAVPAADNPEAEEYILGPRDVLLVKVWGEPEMAEKVEVSGEGTIPFFYVGEVKVAGLTATQVKDKLTRLLADGYIRNPNVIVKIEEYHSKEVQIQGSIANPGTYILTTNYTTLLKLISMAGGTSENRGNWAFVTRGHTWQHLEREGKVPGPITLPGSTAAPADGSTAAPLVEDSRGKAQVIVDLRLLLDRGVYSQDIRIYPGDFVLVGNIETEPPSENYVFVEGAVKNPGRIVFAQGMTALQAVIQAGGFTELASTNRATLTRVGADKVPVTTRVRLRDIQRGKQPDVPLRAGDRINVPESAF